MGVLLQAEYWRTVSEQMFLIRPVRGRTLSKEDTITFLDTTCKALSDLIDDEKFKDDLEIAAQLYENHPPKPEALGGFHHFMSEFRRSEVSLLLQSGMNLDCAVDLVDELQSVAQFLSNVTSKTIRELPEQLNPLRDKACKAAKEERSTSTVVSGVTRFWRAVKGCAAIGIDSAAGAAMLAIDPVFTGPLMLGTVTATSVGIGVALVMEARKELPA